MTIASGIYKVTSWKKQTGLGSPASGSGGKTARRVTSVFQANRDMYESNEITTHRMSTGVSYGLKSQQGTINALLSSGTFADIFAGILGRDMAAIPALDAQTITYGGTTPNWTLGGADFITDGLKVGHVIRASGGSVTANNARNFLIVALTQTQMTVRALDGDTVSAGSSTTTILTVQGKVTFAPTSSQTKDYFTIEEWYGDIERSELFTDMRPSSIAVALPATGNATIDMEFVGLRRTLSGTQVLTTPVTTSTPIMAAINGLIYVNGAAQQTATAINFTISNAAANAGAVIGSNEGLEVTTGRISVSGSFMAQYDSATLQGLYDDETETSITVVLTGDETGDADFMAFTFPKVKITSDTPDDGEQAIMRTYNFTAEYNAAGGSGVNSEQTIVVIQDSAA